RPTQPASASSAISGSTIICSDRDRPCPASSADPEQNSGVGSDALALPIAITGRLGSLWPLQLLWRRLAAVPGIVLGIVPGLDRRSLPARFGFGQRTLGGGR